MSRTATSRGGWANSTHALAYLAEADSFPHRHEGEQVLLDHLPLDASRVLDLGTGDGRLLTLLRQRQPDVWCVGLDVSEPMLTAARRQLPQSGHIELRHHDLEHPLPDLGAFDAVVSCLAIHNLDEARQQALYAEVLDQLAPGGIFCNLDHVASPSARLHEAFYRAIGDASSCFDDPRNENPDLETHLRWLNDAGFDDVDCHWKWLELALVAGVKPN